MFFFNVRTRRSWDSNWREKILKSIQQKFSVQQLIALGGYDSFAQMSEFFIVQSKKNNKKLRKLRKVSGNRDVSPVEIDVEKVLRWVEQIKLQKTY